MTVLQELCINNNAILKFVEAFESVDKDKAGKDQEKPLSKKALVQQIKELALENKKIFNKNL